MKRPMLESPAFPLFALPFVALGAIPSALDGNIGGGSLPLLGVTSLLPGGR
jgi:hypothetical protein